MPWRALQNTFRSIRSFCAELIVTTKPRPSLPPDFEMLWLTVPMTSPARLNMGPPELPVLIVAVVWKNSARGMSLTEDVVQVLGPGRRREGRQHGCREYHCEKLLHAVYFERWRLTGSPPETSP